MKTRFIWIDWMKIIGMYLIISSHLWAPYNGYIYIFSVPVFFIISGFLSKKESSNKLFYTKLFYNLIIPCILYCILLLIWDSIFAIHNDTFTIKKIFHRTFNIILGYQGQNMPYGGLGVCWFIYTLCIVKILSQYTSKILNLIISIIFILISCYLCRKEIHLYNSWVNILLAYPCFMIGTILQKFKYTFNDWNNKMQMFLSIIICSFIIYICYEFNGPPWMYDNHYGNYITIFFLGAISGSLLLFTISKFLSSFKGKYIHILSTGNILILGLHPIAMTILQNIPLFYKPSWYMYLGAAIIMVLFYPIILFCNHRLPFLLGTYRIQPSQTNFTK